MFKFLEINILLLIATCLATGCSNGGGHSGKTPITQAVVTLSPTKGNQVSGTVKFEQVEEGVRILAEIKGLTPGNHGFHIHQYGDCSASDGSSAGGHFNPGNNRHGAPTVVDRHAGDLGNLTADANGNGSYDRIDHVIQLNGEKSIIGKSVIIHADGDDLISQPTGNAGKRVACGVIEPVHP